MCDARCSSACCPPRGRRRRRGGRAGRAGRAGRGLLLLLLVAILVEDFGVAYAGRDYYDILGVSRDADAASIRRAFRRLAREHHPDKNGGDKTSEKLYVELNTAYEVLSDEGKRQRYDRFGEDGVKQGGGGGGGGGGGWGDFDSFFGFGGGRKRERQPEERRGPDLVVPLSLSLEMLYRGGVLEAAHKKRVLCSSWEDCESKCSRCGGSGVVITTRNIGPGFVQQVRSHCPKCGGTGKVTKKNCTACPKGQFEEAEELILIDIEPGFADGHRIVFEGLSDEIPDHVPGNLYFEVDSEPHASFHREGDDLHYLTSVSLTEALVGIDRAVRQLDGRIVPIRTTGVTVPHQEVVVKGEGMPKDDGSNGDLIVHVTVDFPKEVTDEQREAIVKVHGAAPVTEIGNGGGTYTPEAAAGETDAEKGAEKEEL